MKKAWAYFIVVLAVLTVLYSCSKCNDLVDYRVEMRQFVANISSYAKTRNSKFYVVPQNGQELAINSSGSINLDYLQRIDAQAREDMYFGYDNDDVATPTDVSADWERQLDIVKSMGKTILSIDYCSSAVNISASKAKNASKRYVSFAATHRNLATIPSEPIPFESDTDITQLNQAKNFLYLINGANYSSKNAFVDAVKNTNYDLVIIDLYQNEEAFTATDINALKIKKNRAKRLVICYMSIGEAEDYRYYWSKNWKTKKPKWLGKENPDWAGNYKVCYWDKSWQNIIYGSSDSYTQKIIDANFDGVYLDIVDAFEYYENKN